MLKNNEIFHALMKEGQFTCEILCSGVTQIRKANYARKGIYFETFSNLSIGLERIGKLCLILNYILENKKLPDKSFLLSLKNEFGHDLKKIYEKISELKEKHKCDFNFLKDLNSEIHLNILEILSKFANSDRYANINLIMGKKTNDPIKIWYEKVDIDLFKNIIPEKTKKQIIKNAQQVDTLLRTISTVQHVSEDNKEITNIEDASYRTGISESIANYRQLYTIQIIRFFVEVIFCFQDKIMEKTKIRIPFFTEIFGIFYNPDSYVKTRKTWKMK